MNNYSISLASSVCYLGKDGQRQAILVLLQPGHQTLDHDSLTTCCLWLHRDGHPWFGVEGIHEFWWRLFELRVSRAAVLQHAGVQSLPVALGGLRGGARWRFEEVAVPLRGRLVSDVFGGGDVCCGHGDELLNPQHTLHQAGILGQAAHGSVVGGVHQAVLDHTCTHHSRVSILLMMSSPPVIQRARAGFLTWEQRQHRHQGADQSVDGGHVKQHLRTWEEGGRTNRKSESVSSPNLLTAANGSSAHLLLQQDQLEEDENLKGEDPENNIVTHTTIIITITIIIIMIAVVFYLVSEVQDQIPGRQT